ncbi:Tlg2-vesicle protein [Ophidiomyces ophidiicola]|uniref:Tlg2-vesicle protein n=1 Tax=Ophidiomyces ophidiicola TaxID=1387563 RepID=A0ACB8UU12_9EURO|nr:Tlg2-vesicle protein [Ophidiomyces ophidiicola]KAI1913262.1 Tlg2-vesicle protein [Ophidiomyces ophidiicola]KAI1941003.1 Tlg2-vesicle protein [Ophidiomyces ophidiicola]KAI1944561.1 Tlg2-vesicle protein [Ophidiomyces ophidiicola]KAI2004739.1 Tlg2-vesicle protein [Ophidiomyces ophidiicola]KAI2028752.1 Tlg2-vesicle protein [Ophidiomyces ophidiicola]
MPMHSHLDAAELLPASPLSREQSISPGLEPIRPPWSRPRSSLSRRRRTSSTFSLVASVGFRDKAINRIRRTYIRLYDLWTELTVWQKVVTIFAFLVVSAFTVGFMILSGHIFKWLEPVASDWEKSPLVYFVLWVCTFIVSFPPLIGWSAIGTVCGYLFGIWKGWIVFATATVVGSTCAFILSRTIFSEFVHRIIKHDKRFAALALTLKYDGLKLLCMIRLCPLPYSVCNGAISTFPTVQPLMYGLATAIITPKLFVATFIGSRLRILAQSGEKMGAIPKAINITSIIIGVCIGIFTGCTLARAAELEAEERAILAQAASDPSQLPPPGSFADDPDEFMAASSPLDRDEEEQIGFRDQERELRRDIDNDHVAIDTRGYQDELTDNDSDIFGEGDGEIDDTYSLHRRT